MSTAKSTIRVKVIDHITLVVNNLEKARAFYEDLLGMNSVPRPDFGFPGLWFQAGNTQIHMNVEGPEAGQAGFPPLGSSLPSRGFHFAFEVDSCEEAAASLRSQGVEIVTGPRTRPDGATQLYIYDPDGHLVELYSNQ